MKKIKTILDNYDLEVKSIEKMNAGYVSTKWIITDCNDQKYVLKEIKNQIKDRIEFILKVQDSLRKMTVNIVKTNNGDNYCENNDNYYYLTKYVSNNSIILDEKQAYIIGAFLGKLHKKMQKIKNLSSDYLKIENNYNILQDFLKYYKENRNKELCDIISYKIKILNNIDFSIIDYNKLEKQIVHGDFYIDNILFDKQYKIVDFDQCCIFYKEYELFRAMFMLFIDNKIKTDTLNKMREFYNGYSSYNSIKSPLDAYNLYLYVQANSLSGLNPNKKDMEFAIKRYNIVKFLCDNKKEIITVLGGDV